MSREKEFCDIIEYTRKFENEFHFFFTNEYCHECPDVDAIKESSLVAEDGTFHFKMLTGSRFFEDLTFSFTILREIANLTNLNSAEKTAFEWIFKVYCWIGRIKSSLSAGIPYCQQHSIGQAKAEELVSEGDTLLKELPDNLIQLLSFHNIHLSTSLSGLSMSITLGETDAVRSCGLILIRWWRFLYNALKSDYSHVSVWKNKTKDLVDDYERLQRGDESRLMKEPKALIPYYQCRDQAERLLCKLDDLFLTPSSDSIEKCSLVLKLCRNVIHTRSCLAASQAYAKSQYSDDTAVIDNSLLLLDALAERTELTGHTAPVRIDISQNTTSTTDSAREQCRSALHNVLKNALISVAISHTDLNALCSVRAWEIENAIYDICSSNQPDIYVAKVKSIKCGLKDVGNLQLALSVLYGALAVDELANMTSEQLASPDIQKMMEKRTLKIRQSCLLTHQQDTSMRAEVLSENLVGNDIQCINEQPETLRRSQNVMLRHEVTNLDHLTVDQSDHNSVSKLGDALIRKKNSASSSTIPAGNVMKLITKNETSVNTKDFGNKTSIIRSRNFSDAQTEAPPAPPSLNPLSDSSLALPVIPVLKNLPLKAKPQRFAKTVSGDEILYFILPGRDGKIDQKTRVRLEPDSSSTGHKLLPNSMRKCRWSSYKTFMDFIRCKQEQLDNLVLTFKACPASDGATNNLLFVSEKADQSDRVLVLESKCSSNCCEIKCRACTKWYLVTPKFQQLFHDAFHFSDPNSLYVITVDKI